MEKEDAQLLLELAIELHLRVLVQLHTMSSQEFHTTELSYIDRENGEVRIVKIVEEGDRTREAFEEM
jgi:ATP-dependent Lon protease